MTRQPGQLWLATIIIWMLFFLAVSALDVGGVVGNALFLTACFLVVIATLETAGWIWSSGERTFWSLGALWTGGFVAMMLVSPFLPALSIILLGVLLLTTARWFTRPSA